MASTTSLPRGLLAVAALSLSLLACSSGGGAAETDVDAAPATAAVHDASGLAPEAPVPSDTLPGPVDSATSGGTLDDGEVLALAPSNHPLIGAPAPDLTMTSLSSGEEVGLADYLGRPVVVNWWATWCVPCRVEMPWLQSVRDAHAESGLEVLLADAGEKVPPGLAATHIARFVDSIGLTLPVLYGENTYDVQEEWTVGALPVTFLVAADGTVADAHQGGYPNRATLDDHVRRVLLQTE